MNDTNPGSLSPSTTLGQVLAWAHTELTAACDRLDERMAATQDPDDRLALAVVTADLRDWIDETVFELLDGDR